MSKTLLVLGAGVYQIPAIRTAKQLGYRVVTTDNRPDNPGHVLADERFAVDTTDVEGVNCIAERCQISGVLAPCTDVGVATAALVAERMHLPGPPPTAAFVLTQKYQFRVWQREHGFPHPHYVVASDLEVPAEIFDGRRWLLKPNQSSGSKGVFIVSTRHDFSARLAETRSFSLDGSAVLEEFIEGTQHTCEGILESGRIALALVTDRDTAPPPYTATTGHRVPTRISPAVQASMFRMVEEVSDLLHIRSGPFDCDFVVSPGGVVLLEITPRLGGNSLSMLFSAALGFDLPAYAVAHACGDEYEIPDSSRPRSVGVIILGAGENGELAWNRGEALAMRCEPWVESLIFDRQYGESVEGFTNGRHRVGEALVTGVDRNNLDDRILEFKKRLALRAIPRRTQSGSLEARHPTRSIGKKKQAISARH